MDTPFTMARKKPAGSAARDHDGLPGERLLLGMIAGCCQQEPRDEVMLSVLLAQLRLAQARRELAGSRVFALPEAGGARGAGKF